MEKIFKILNYEIALFWKKMYNWVGSDNRRLSDGKFENYICRIISDYRADVSNDSGLSKAKKRQ